MKASKFFRISAVLVASALSLRPASAATDVVTSIPELAAIAKAVGGDRISIYSVAKPNQDYHQVEPRPSDVARISRAKLVVRAGLAFDGWMDSLMNAAGNGNLNRGGNGYVDASTGIPPIERLEQSVTGAAGDVHPQGNPHYYYDPIYAKRAAQNIVRGLIRVDAAGAADYRANYVAFNRTVDQKMVGWRATLAPYVGRPVVTYHRNYNYILRRFGLRQYGTLEPKPGIPPSAAHISQLISQMKRDNVKGILVENIYPRRFADLMGRQLGVTPQFGPISVQAYTGASYFNLIDTLVARLKAAVD